MARRRQDDPPAGSPAWMATFSDLMNLLLCFFVLLFSMSTVDEEKYNQLVASITSAFSILDGGATAIGDGILVSNGVSQLNELDQYINSTGNTADNTVDSDEFEDYEHGDEMTDAEKFEQMLEKIENHNLTVNEQLAEIIEEAVNESGLKEKIDVSFTSQYVELSLKGALLFDSGKAELKSGSLPVMERVAVILERYAGSTIEIEGHTDIVPISSAKYANNNELSSARALSVFDYLVENTSLDPADIKHSGRGEYVPIADNSTEEGRAKNRRVEIRIYNPVIQ
jgi:chemotaxis protein MotB